jgi:predicted transcriptional regulator
MRVNIQIDISNAFLENYSDKRLESFLWVKFIKAVEYIIKKRKKNIAEAKITEQGKLYTMTIKIDYDHTRERASS